MNERQKLWGSYQWKVKDQKDKGFPFLMSFDEFYDAWVTSGKLEKRTAGWDGYVMTKRDYDQPFSLNNYRIVTRGFSKTDLGNHGNSAFLSHRKSQGMAQMDPKKAERRKKRIAESRRNKQHSPETRAKMSAAKKGNQNARKTIR